MLLNTRFYVDKAFDRQMFLAKINSWLQNSNNFTLPEIEFDFKQDELIVESESKDQRVNIYNFDDRFALQVTVNSEGATYTTTFVLDDKSDKHSLHLSQNKVFTTISVENDKRQAVNLPNIVKEIFWDECGDYDGDIMTDDKPLLLRKNMVDMAANILSQKNTYLNPVVYVSLVQRTGLPDVDCNKIAQELMGQAHVVVESSPLVSKKVQEALENKELQPYDGAIRILFPGGDSKLFIRNKALSNFDYAVINSVRRIMAGVTIEDSFSIAKMRQRVMLNKIANSDDKEFAQMAEEMLNEKDAEIATRDKEIENLKQKLYDMTNKADVLQNSFDKTEAESDGGINIAAEAPEMYDGEYLNVILKVLKKEYDSMTGDANLAGSRKYDVLGDVLAHNFPRTTDADLIKCIEEAFKSGNISRDGIGSLKRAGFTVEKGSRASHYKVYFKNFDKYFVTVASTPSDKRGMKNTISDLINILFGY